MHFSNSNKKGYNCAMIRQLLTDGDDRIEFVYVVCLMMRTELHFNFTILYTHSLYEPIYISYNLFELACLISGVAI